MDVHCCQYRKCYYCTSEDFSVRVLCFNLTLTFVESSFREDTRPRFRRPSLTCCESSTTVTYSTTDPPLSTSTTDVMAHAPLLRAWPRSVGHSFLWMRRTAPSSPAREAGPLQLEMNTTTQVYLFIIIHFFLLLQKHVKTWRHNVITQGLWFNSLWLNINSYK